TQADMQAFYADMKGRMTARGRTPEDCAILPQMIVVIGETIAIAREKAEYLNSLIDPELSLAASSSGLGADLSRVKDESELAAAQRHQGMRGTEDRIRSAMKSEGLSFAEAARRSVRGLVVGTPVSIADHMQALYEARACDGFVVSPAVYPGMFEQFCR